MTAASRQSGVEGIDGSVDLKVMPIDPVTMIDAHDPGERAPTPPICTGTIASVRSVRASSQHHPDRRRHHRAASNGPKATVYGVHGATAVMLLERLSQIRGRLERRLGGLPDDMTLRAQLEQLPGSALHTLLVSEAWDTGSVGGEEADGPAVPGLTRPGEDQNPAWRLFPVSAGQVTG